MVRLMRHVKLSATIVSSDVDAAIALHDIGPPDLLIVFSLSVTFRAALEAAALARRRRAPVVAIIGNDMSPLKQYADHVIVAPTKSSTMWYSTVGVVAAVEMIMAHVASRRRQLVLDEERELYDLYLDRSLIAPLHTAIDDDPESRI